MDTKMDSFVASRENSSWLPCTEATLKNFTGYNREVTTSGYWRSPNAVSIYSSYYIAIHWIFYLGIFDYKICIRYYLDFGTLVVGDEQLRHGESNFNSFNCSCSFYRVLNESLYSNFQINNNIISIDFILRVPFLNADTKLSPTMIKMLNSFEKMPSPRIFKSHLPFYLLHPELLDTAKVNLTFHLLLLIR